MSKSLFLRFVFGRQRHNHPFPLHGGPGGSKHHTNLCCVPATPQCCSARGEMDLPAGGHRPARGRTPHRPRQHEEGPFLWQLHKEFLMAQNEADGGEAGEGL